MNTENQQDGDSSEPFIFKWVSNTFSQRVEKKSSLRAQDGVLSLSMLRHFHLTFEDILFPLPLLQEMFAAQLVDFFSLKYSS